MKISTIIFDVDGVLIDSNKIIVDAYQKTAKSLDLRVPSAREISNLLGTTLEDIVKTLWPNTDKDLLVSTYRKLFMGMSIIPPIEGAPETVERLKKSGFKLGITSGKIRFFIDKHLEEAGFDLKLFDIILSGEDTKKHKPDPEPLIRVCNELKVKPEEVIYVGDSQFDYECAKNAKVHYVAVLTGCLSEKELKDIGIKHILNSVSELPKFLEMSK